MIDWNDLEHAYGSASDIPQLLSKLSPNPRARVWNELWSRLCHQGSVFSASFAALPFLADAIVEWPAEARAMPLTLAGCIVASRDVVCSLGSQCAADPLVVQRLLAAAVDTLASPDLKRDDYVYILESALAFRGDHPWGDDTLSGLVDGDIQGKCPSCDTFLLFTVSGDTLCVTLGGWPDHGSAKEGHIEPAAPDAMNDAGRWMYDQAMSGGQAQIAVWIRHLFGHSVCPECGQAFSVPDAVARAAA